MMQNLNTSDVYSTEDALKACGNGGAYQRKAIFFISIQYLLIAFISTGWSLFFEQPEYICYEKQASISQNQDNQIQDQQEELVNGHICNEEQACSNLYFIKIIPPRQNFNNIIMDFKLICDRKYWIELSYTIFILGGIGGYIYYAEVMERWGRLKALMQSVTLISIASICGYFLFNIQMFMICMCIVNIGYKGFQISSIIFISEISSENLRVLSPCFFYVGWAFGQIIIGTIAYIFMDWRLILVMFTGLPLFAVSFFLLFMTDSPRYLMTKKKYIETKKSLLNMKIRNKRNVPNFTLLEEERNQTQKGHLISLLSSSSKKNNFVQKIEYHSFLSLVTYNSIRIRTLIMIYLWSVVSFSYYFTSKQAEKYFKDYNLHIIWMGVLEVVAYLISANFALNYERKKVIKSILWIVGLIQITFIIFLPSPINIISKFIIFILIIFVRLAISGLFCFLNVYTTEIFPTTIRHYAFGITGTCQALMILLVEYIQSQIQHHIMWPFIASGATMLLTIAFMPKMQETFQKNFKDFLPDEQQEAQFNIQILK